MESGEFLEPNPPIWGLGCSGRLGRNAQQLALYSVLCVLLKSEAIFTFFVYWLRGLQLSTGTPGTPGYKVLSHLWLLKPVFALIIDGLNLPLSYTTTTNSSTVWLGYLGVGNGRVLVLLGAEYLLALSSLLIYLLFHFDRLDSPLTNLFAYILGLSLVSLSAYAEGLFCRFVQNRPNNSYTKLISLRLMMSSLYGLTTLLCLLFPVLFHNCRLSKYLQVNLLFPLFLIFNAAFVSFLTRTLRYSTSSSGSSLKVVSPISTPFNSNGSGGSSSGGGLNVQVLLSLLLLLLLSIRMRNDFFNRYNYTGVDHYLFVVATQLFKFLSSLLVYYFIGAKTLSRVAVLIFGGTLLMLYPLKAFTGQFLTRVPKLPPAQVFSLGFLLSLVQQLLLSYSLLVSLLIVPKGLESSLLSLPTFTVHLSHVALRQHAVDYLSLSRRQRVLLQCLTFSLFLYCLTVLLNFNQHCFRGGGGSISGGSGGGIGGVSKLKTYKDHLRNTYGLSFLRVHGQPEPKSPWELHSEVSNDLDTL